MAGISESSVLWGIAAPRCIIHNPAAGLALGPIEETIDLAEENFPTKIGFDPVGEILEAKSHRLIPEYEGFRVKFVFTYDYLEPADAAEWGKIFNYLIAGYKIKMIPHYGNALKIDWEVIPTTGFNLGFFAERYIAHSAQFTFESVYLQTAVNLKTAVNTFGPITH